MLLVQNRIKISLKLVKNSLKYVQRSFYMNIDSSTIFIQFKLYFIERNFTFNVFIAVCFLFTPFLFKQLVFGLNSKNLLHTK